MPSFQSLYVTIAVLAVVALLLKNVIYDRFLTPLRVIPGPFLASVTDKWLLYYDLAGLRTLTIDELHRKYGPIVRVAPGEVSLSDSSVVDQIYGQRTVFMKAPVYESMSMRPLGIFSLRERTAHSQRRSLLAHSFSQPAIDDCLPVILEKADLLLKLFKQDRMPTTDVYLRFRLFSLDVVGELFLGNSFGALEANTAPQFLHDMDQAFLLGGLEWNFPWLVALLWRFPVPPLRDFLEVREHLRKFGRSALDDYIQQYGRAPKRRDLLTKILVPEGEQMVLSDRETYTEISNLVFAGTDTTSTTLTYMFWSLARFPEWQARIRTEINEKTGSDMSKLYEKLSTTDMPVMEAVINEALRLYPAAPASLPRVVPKEGWHWNSYTIPAETVVSMQCYTTQRDPLAFLNPDVFAPDRWLKGEPSPAMKSLFMPFSKGSRACLGKRLAMLELRLVVLTLLSRFDVKLPPQTTEDSMLMRDHFLVLPKAGKCDLIFTPLSDKAKSSL